MTKNYTPLDEEVLHQIHPGKKAPHINTVLFGVATLTILIFAVTVSVLFQQRAQAQNEITLPPVLIETETSIISPTPVDATQEAVLN